MYISYIKDEIGRSVRGLFVEAQNFFERVQLENHTLVLSDLFFYEVEKVIFESCETVLQNFKIHKISVERVYVTLEAFKRAQRFAQKYTHLLDAQHAALAIQSKCDALVTFNAKDFENIKQIWICPPNEF